MPIGGKDAFLSKVTFRRESDWVSKTKQLLNDMKTLEERAKHNLSYEKDFLGRDLSDNMVCRAYVKGATEQRTIDEESYTEEMRKLNEEWEENLAECKRQRDAYYDELTRLRQERVELIDKACEQEPFAMYILAMNHVYVERLDNEELVQFKNSCYNDYLDALREMYRRGIKED